MALGCHHGLELVATRPLVALALAAAGTQSTQRRALCIGARALLANRAARPHPLVAWAAALLAAGWGLYERGSPPACPLLAATIPR